MAGDTPFVVIDDDPTGTQTMAGVRVLLRPDRDALRETATRAWPAVHLMTNSRAAAPRGAYDLVSDACRHAAATWPDAEIVLRGDSTLRAHLVPEYDALRDVRFPGQEPVLLLAPALPEAGRITIDGVHVLERAGSRAPLHETEYGRDPALGYHTAHLLSWAEERSEGRFVAADGAHVGLAELREGGAAPVVQRLERLTERGRGVVCAADAETVDDLRHLAEAFAAARRGGLPVILRCAPTLAGILTGATATQPAELPRSRGGVLLVCGSFVPTATRQLAAVADAYPDAVVEPDLDALITAPLDEITRTVQGLATRLSRTGFAVLATPRPGADPPGGRDRQERVADRLAAIVAALPVGPATLVTKGGVTSAVTIGQGLGAAAADVIGPVAPGVGRWEVVGRSGHRTTCLVVPGNVGEDRLLLDLVVGLTAERS